MWYSEPAELLNFRAVGAGSDNLLVDIKPLNKPAPTDLCSKGDLV